MVLVPRGDEGGLTGALPYNPLEWCILAACTAIAWAFTVELNLVAILTFKRRRRLYFWSLLICSWGCTLHALGFILKFLVGTSWLLNLVFIEIGWVCMVSGQSFVLYSRLNLVVRSKTILRCVLAAIIIDGFALHTPTLVFIYGANSPSSDRWVAKFNIMERIQLMGFSIQESVISTIYIVATVKLLGAVYYTRTRQAMLQLLGINFLCIAMDLVLIGLEFSSLYVAEASVKPLIYAVKLKLEFAVYAQLRGFTKANFEAADRESVHGEGDNSSTTGLQGPVDFFKQFPKAVKGPPTAPSPTVHTHPEQILKRKNPLNDMRRWDDSQVDFSASTIAAALTAGGRDRSATPRGKKRRSLLRNQSSVDSRPGAKKSPSKETTLSGKTVTSGTDSEIYGAPLAQDHAR